MKNQIITKAIVLSRTDYGEADRILTLLTPDFGKVSAIAKGVRRPRSKLAGGIELLSISTVTVLPGRGDLGRLVSARMTHHFGGIIQDIDRTLLAYSFLKRINRVTESVADEEYFQTLENTLEALDDIEIPMPLIDLWFGAQLLDISGHRPNLRADAEGKSLQIRRKYSFDFEDMAFRTQKGALYSANHIKLLRLSFNSKSPQVLTRVTNAIDFVPEILELVSNLIRLQLRV